MVNTLDAGFGGEGQISLNILKTVFLGKRRIGRAYKRKKQEIKTEYTYY